MFVDRTTCSLVRLNFISPCGFPFPPLYQEQAFLLPFMLPVLGCRGRLYLRGVHPHRGLISSELRTNPRGFSQSLNPLLSSSSSSRSIVRGVETDREDFFGDFESHHRYYHDRPTPMILSPPFLNILVAPFFCRSPSPSPWLSVNLHFRQAVPPTPTPSAFPTLDMEPSEPSAWMWRGCRGQLCKTSCIATGAFRKVGGSQPRAG